LEWTRGAFRISDDQGEADLDFIVGGLHDTYWARNRSREVITRSLEHSVLLSLFYEKQQIGLTRLVTDWTTFTWVCDVYVDPDYRGQGLGKWLIECAMDHPASKAGLKLLATRDAHELYEQLGFKRRQVMFRRDKPPTDG
jgi:GNAT superfamily N-acetyltransferase